MHDRAILDTYLNMPALTLSTDNPNKSRSSSPTRPPVSPITPPLAPARLADNTTSNALPPRQTFTHSQPDQVAVTAPAPEPISFDSNPDAIALRSAISVLQVQRKRAAADIQTLSKAMDEAVADPTAFIEDLAAGKVQTQGAAGRTSAIPAADEDEDDDEDEDEEDESKKTHPRPWASLPAPQNVVRTPPVNWSQYAIVGDSLDKLHNEQVSRPAQGSPAVYRPDGTYEFRGDGKQEKYPGVAAPYNPVKDKLDKRPRTKK